MCMWVITSNFLFQVIALPQLLNKEDQIITIAMYWVLWTISLIGAILIWYYQKDQYWIYIMQILLLRNLIPYFDFEDRRSTNNETQIGLFLVIQSIAVLLA